MSESNPWADQWFKAQRQFVDAWSEMAKSNPAGSTSRHSDLWSQSFDLWRNACQGQTQPDVQTVLNKCMDMGKEYFTMAEQVGKSLGEGKNPMEAVNTWLEQLTKTLQQFVGQPGFNGAGVGDFMQQWFTPNATWQDMVSGLAPINQSMWQFPGMGTPSFNIGELVDPMGKALSAPGIGYFREPQEKQQKGMQLLIEYNQANFKFNQAFLRVAIESIQGFQQRLGTLDVEKMPKTLRELYDLWVTVSEEHYAEFAMSEEYQALYGDMVNKLMILKKHYSEINDDILRALNLPNTREVDTMQHRLQQLRRENFRLKKEIKEIKAMLMLPAEVAKAAKAPKKAAVKKAPAAKKSAATKAKAGARA